MRGEMASFSTDEMTSFLSGDMEPFSTDEMTSFSSGDMTSFSTDEMTSFRSDVPSYQYRLLHNRSRRHKNTERALLRSIIARVASARRGVVPLAARCKTRAGVIKTLYRAAQKKRAFRHSIGETEATCRSTRRRKSRPAFRDA